MLFSQHHLPFYSLFHHNQLLWSYCLFLTEECDMLNQSARVNPPLFSGCLSNSFSANLVYIKPIWSETGVFRDVVGLFTQQPAPSWEEAGTQKSKNLQTVMLTKSLTCSHMILFINNASKPFAFFTKWKREVEKYNKVSFHHKSLSALHSSAVKINDV